MKGLPMYRFLMGLLRSVVYAGLFLALVVFMIYLGCEETRKPTDETTTEKLPEAGLREPGGG